MLDIKVIGYDIFDILVNYWHVQINQKQNRIGKNRINKAKNGTDKLSPHLQKHEECHAVFVISNMCIN